jgi:hypothetical protein
MRLITPLEERRPADLHDHALDHIRYIRSAMERAGVFTAVPGWGQVVVGATALAAAFFASREPSVQGWFTVWIVEALAAVTIGVAAMAHKSRMAGMPPLGVSARRFAMSFSLPIMAGAVITAALYRAGRADLLPGVWLLLYGTAFAAGGAFSVGIVRALGFCFMAVGGAALFTPASWGNAWMAFAFGGLHIGFGIAIARKHGG